MFIRGQGKIGYIIGEKTVPNSADPLFFGWNVENSMVMTLASKLHGYFVPMSEEI